jgi:hypothetical protein
MVSRLTSAWTEYRQSKIRSLEPSEPSAMRCVGLACSQVLERQYSAGGDRHPLDLPGPTDFFAVRVKKIKVERILGADVCDICMLLKKSWLVRALSHDPDPAIVIGLGEFGPVDARWVGSQLSVVPL